MLEYLIISVIILLVIWYTKEGFGSFPGMPSIPMMFGQPPISPKDPRYFCYMAHSKMGQNHPWLQPVNGGLAFVTFIDPATRQEFEFNEDMWVQHCTFVNHNPLVLVKSHSDAYFGPVARQPEPIYHFRDGTTGTLRQHPEYLQMETEWFTKQSQQQSASDSAA